MKKQTGRHARDRRTHRHADKQRYDVWRLETQTPKHRTRDRQNEVWSDARSDRRTSKTTKPE